MAHIRCDFFSEVLGLSTSMSVILPQRAPSQDASEAPVSTSTVAPPNPQVLYLLHGFTDDDTAWIRRTSIQRYVSSLGLAVVMPQVHRSFYADEIYGNKYWTFLSEELPELVDGFFKVSSSREDTFVAGVSMGGYGAFKWALRQPERFAAAASISGSLGMATRPRPGDPKKDLLDRIFGDTLIEGTNDDVGWLVQNFDQAAGQIAERPAGLSGIVMPQLYMCCGTEDNLIQENEKFLALARRKGAPVTAGFGPGGHDWDYWDARIQDVLAWLPLRGRI
ncbi:esterase family protein [Nakamurella antarctica]|uniref:Esterase family protein n=1 Tax=Nakamurella antarctica TaxID=1902245 RepID=A0A3G8ZLN7_9ACTN|nr:alpha/beta hydrolase family protein [Nakamurella antarctica]AZI58173.1 esterase family protein [Nakamurella antarctica]